MERGGKGEFSARLRKKQRAERATDGPLKNKGKSQERG